MLSGVLSNTRSECDDATYDAHPHQKNLQHEFRSGSFCVRIYSGVDTITRFCWCPTNFRERPRAGGSVRAHKSSQQKMTPNVHLFFFSVCLQTKGSRGRHWSSTFTSLPWLVLRLSLIAACFSPPPPSSSPSSLESEADFISTSFSSCSDAMWAFELGSRPFLVNEEAGGLSLSLSLSLLSSSSSSSLVSSRDAMLV